jgi:hypothetical protein
MIFSTNTTLAMNKDKVIEKQLADAKNELIAWLNDECPSCFPPLEPYTTADLSHGFAEGLRQRLDGIIILRGKLSEAIESDKSEEYASQSSVEVTDREIDEWAEMLFKSSMEQEDAPKTVSHEKLCLHERHCLKHGARWMRDKLHPAQRLSDEQIENMQGFVNLIKQITEDTPELNMGNYSDEQVHLLNDAMVEIYKLVHQFK